MIWGTGAATFTVFVTASCLTIVAGVPPQFEEPLKNLTVPIGRDATFTCVVRNLGGYRVGWVKADTKAIQAIHTHVITHNPRVRVSHRDQTTWNLHINQVQEEDRGMYMCQINYDPMLSQYGYLNVVVPPDIVDAASSGDLNIPEGGSGELRCTARGYPQPQISWMREDGRDITVSSADDSGGMYQRRVTEYRGEVLPLHKVKRSDTGHYLCIASNGLPPVVSKRISVEVHFHPAIQVPSQLHGVPLGTNVTLRCHVEALPKSINFWEFRSDRPDGEMLIESKKYNIIEVQDSEYSLWMNLTINSFEASDAGEYICTAKNSIGEVSSVIRVYEIRRAEPGEQTPEREQAEPEPEPDITLLSEVEADRPAGRAAHETEVPYEPPAAGHGQPGQAPLDPDLPPEAARAAAVSLLPGLLPTLLTLLTLLQTLQTLLSRPARAATGATL